MFIRMQITKYIDIYIYIYTIFNSKTITFYTIIVGNAFLSNPA